MKKPDETAAVFWDLWRSGQYDLESFEVWIARNHEVDPSHLVRAWAALHALYVNLNGGSHVIWVKGYEQIRAGTGETFSINREEAAILARETILEAEDAGETRYGIEVSEKRSFLHDNLTVVGAIAEPYGTAFIWRRFSYASGLMGEAPWVPVTVAFGSLKEPIHDDLGVLQESVMGRFWQLLPKATTMRALNAVKANLQDMCGES